MSSLVEIKRWLAAHHSRKPCAHSVLTYHSVGYSGGYSLSRSRFRDHIAMLGSRAQVTTLDNVLYSERATESRSVRHPPVTAITFDDGYRDVLEHAAPELCAVRLPFTVFITTDFMTNPDLFRWSPHYRGVPPLSWSQVHELMDAGATIGAHTCSHPRLSTLNPQSIEREILRSKLEIEDKLGAEVRMFAYPFGQSHDYSRECRKALVKGGFHLACSTIQRTLRPGEDALEVPRLTVGARSTPEDVNDLITGRYDFMSWYGAINSALVRAGLRATVAPALRRVE